MLHQSVAKDSLTDFIQNRRGRCLSGWKMADQSEHWCRDWYERKAAVLVLYGRTLGLGHGEAEDVLHETFGALLKLREAPEDPGNYCVRAFRNRALNYRRGLFRRLTRELEAKGWFEEEAGFDPRETAAVAALRQLPAEQREVIVLRIWHRLSYEEIGTLQEVPANTAAGRYRYGIEKLRTHFSGENDHETERFRADASAMDPEEGVSADWAAALWPRCVR
jgi:RNA polymerase sigma-70 factor (ECF subfamily)